jgi:hypothetical protein
METVPVTETCFLGVLDSGKCLQTESLIHFIKIHSVIRCIHKNVKSDYYLHHVCLLGMTQLPLGLFSWNFFLENLLRKLKFYLSQTGITDTLREDKYTFLTLSRSVLGMRNVSDKVVKKIKTRFICSNFFFFLLCLSLSSKNHAIVMR